MDPRFIIETIRQLEEEIDLISPEYEDRTVYASPDSDAERRIDTTTGGCEIPRW